ncbi:BON domain-containing protein [Polaromonas sp.]|uniref:BON domain-containing protein n=1 Tax=Polaromonas sp. TaxID=1869339 RepID=UPI003BABDE87
MKTYKPFISHRPALVLTTACSLALLLALGACGKKDEGQSVGQQLDSAVAKTEQAAIEAKAKAESSMAKAGESVKEEAQKAEVSGQKAADSVAGSVDDMAITASISAAFAKDSDLSAIRIDVDTKNGNVTLSGPAPTASARDKATAIAKGIKGVSSVDNKLMVKAS